MSETRSQDGSLSLSLQVAPILFWRMDLLKRSFENLNQIGCGILDKDNYRFFKDSTYRDKLVFPQDLAAVNAAVADIKQRLPVSVMFRIGAGNTVRWFKLTGWPVGGHRYYDGIVEEISEHISQLQDILLKRGRRLYSVDQENYPVAIFRKNDKQLIRYNLSFADLMNLSAEPGKGYRLDAFVSSAIKWPLLEERLLLNGSLSESLLLTAPDGRRIDAHCLFEGFDFQAEDLIRLAVVDVIETTIDTAGRSAATDAAAAIKELCTQLGECQSIGEMLAAIYSRQALLPGLDAVMYSDIYARKNSVFVYACGSLFGTLEPGSQYPYSGTIAENIEKENLEYLIVDDTQASIKAIDWALFVPHGVQSYIAKALYVRGAMRTVLIFCSARKHAFNDRQVGDVTKIATAFHRRLKQFKSR